MPRRRRPSSENLALHSLKPTKFRTNKAHTHGDQPDSDEENSQEPKGSPEATEESDFEDNLDDTPDEPRIAQWEDDDDFEQFERIDVINKGRDGLEALEDTLSKLPLGSLRKAQSALRRAAVDLEDTVRSDESDVDPGDSQLMNNKKTKVKPEWSTKPRADIAKRSNKNAPMEVTSKRPVTRKRTVVEIKQAQPRDPRFLPLTGEFSPEKFQQQYGFLANSHKMELETLRQSLKRARKLLASSPKYLYTEREEEVNKLELAVKRAESLVDKDRRDQVEREALGNVMKEERDKRKQGKAEWWLKDSEKRKLLVRAKYDALAAEGGNRAVKRAIEKKQKKLGQKEKKSRPFTKEPMKRAFNDNGHEDRPQVKRRRIG